MTMSSGPWPNRLIGDVYIAAERVAGLGHTQISHGLVPNLSSYYPEDRYGTIIQMPSETTLGPFRVNRRRLEDRSAASGLSR